MATPETNATFDTSCKTGLKILDYLLSTDVEDSSRFEGKGLNPSFIASSNVLIFLETTRAGLFVGTTGGKGFAIAKVGGSWSAPCYVSLRKFELGAILGFSSSYTIISGLSRRAVQEIIDDNYTEFGTDVTIQLWPKEAGIDDSVAVRLFLVREITLQDYKPIRKQVTLEASQAGFDASKVNTSDFVSASCSNGVLFDFSLSGGALRIDQEKNLEVYGEDGSASNILNGVTPKPKEMVPLYQKISSISRSALN